MQTTRTLIWLLALALLALVLLAYPVPTVRADAPLIVRVKVNGATSGTCGGTWATSCGLQYALTSTVAPAELWVAKGTYTPTTSTDRTATFQLRNDIALYGGFMGWETERSQRNWLMNEAILSGDIGIQGNASDNSYHVVTTSWVTNTAVLDGFTVQDGNANGSDPDFHGGGIFNSNGSPTVSNSMIWYNNASYHGGGMYNDTSRAMLTNVTFWGNTAASGGGMFNYTSSPTLTDTIFYSNTAQYGGGMYNYAYSGPTLANALFWRNTANVGGGMYNSYGNPTLTNVTFFSNTATHNGGAMLNSTSSLTLTNTSIVSNTATYNGGGMDSYSYSIATIANTIFWGNAAPTGPQVNNDATSATGLSDSVVQGGYASGTHIITDDPRPGLIGNWGGNIPTLPILPGSSAIEAGNNGTCALTDQRGLPRVGTCDIGAFEFQGYELSKVWGDHQSTRINTPFADPLIVQLNELDTPLLLPGMTITLTAPSSGASAAWSGSPVVTGTTDETGRVTVAPTANGIGGSYPVTVTGSVATAPVSFTLTNLLYDSFLPLLRR